MQTWRAVRSTPTAAVVLRTTAPTSVAPRREPSSPAGIVPRGIAPSVCCRTVWLRACPTLVELEAVVRAAEQTDSLDAACLNLRLKIELPGGIVNLTDSRSQESHEGKPAGAY
jgi:hypothetical protein